MSVNKIRWLDIMKGIGILTVLAGHVFDGDISRIIFMFHMPLFFVISGFLFNPKPRLKQYFIDKSRSLLIPYFAFLIPLYLFFNRINFTAFSGEEIIWYITKPIIGGRYLTGELGVFWFVTCLFITQQLFNVMVVRLKPKLVLIYVLLLLILSYINSILFPEFWLPWNVNVVLIGIPFFYIGYLFKIIQPQINKLIVLTIGIVVFVSGFYYLDNTFDMKVSNYGIPVFTLISSIVLILNIKNASRLIEKYDILSDPLIKLGRASMVIMYIHQPIHFLVINKFEGNYTYIFLFSTIFSYIIYLILNNTKLTRALFLGSRNEFAKLNNKSLFFAKFKI